MLNFQKYQGGTSSLASLGSVKENAGKGGKIAFVRNNYNNPDKRVAVIITNANGESAVVACSQQVSDALRNKQMKIEQLANLQIVQNEEGINFIAMPATGAIQEFSVDALTAEPTPVSATFLPEELVAF